MRIEIKKSQDSLISVFDRKKAELISRRGALLAFFIDNQRHQHIYINPDRLFVSTKNNRFVTISF